MIIVRSPLRISIGGGGTDIPSYYKEKGSFFISAAINKYVYVTITKPFEKGLEKLGEQIFEAFQLDVENAIILGSKK